MHLCQLCDFQYTDLNLYNKKKTLALPQYIWIFHLVLLGLLLSECEREIILFIISPNIEFRIVLVFVIKFRRIISRTIFGCLLIYFFAIANTPATYTQCLIVFQIWCYSCVKNVSNWLAIILIILSNDIHLNPGAQYQNNFFTFMSWNVNSLAKEEFQRVRLIEAHNSIFNYMI